MKMIGAVSQNGVIGLNNAIPWHDKDDLRRFKKLTTGSTVIMGRRTHESIGKPLPGRHNVIISSNSAFLGVENTSFSEALDKYGNTDAWVIGGESIYRQFLEYCSEIDLTIIPTIITTRGANFFPWINPQKWESSSTMIGNKVYINYRRRE